MFSKIQEQCYQYENESLRKQLSEERAKTQAADRKIKILHIEREDLTMHLVGSRAKARQLKEETETLSSTLQTLQNQYADLQNYTQHLFPMNEEWLTRQREEVIPLRSKAQRLHHDNERLANELTMLMDDKPILACSVCTHPITSDTGVSVAMPCKHAFCTACSTKFPSQCPCCMLVNPEFVKLIFI